VFTGIVQDVGRVVHSEARGGDLRLTFECPRLELARLSPGDSVCVHGCCLTALEVTARTFAADLSRETLALTTLGQLALGSQVNLEPALRAGDPLGGHLLSGHVDGVGEVRARSTDARSVRLSIGVPAGLERFLAPKGSIAVDGVSLTINAAPPGVFEVNIIPHTQAVTTLGALAPGARVNLEIDQVARYIARLMESFTGQRAATGKPQ
jgi:riboflavin synthase